MIFRCFLTLKRHPVKSGVWAGRLDHAKSFAWEHNDALKHAEPERNKTDRVSLRRARCMFDLFTFQTGTDWLPSARIFKGRNRMNGHLTPALIASSLTALFALGISQQTHAADYTPISETCGATTATLQCKAGSRDCTQTTLNLKTADGKTVPLEKPEDLEKQYTAVGLVCGPSVLPEGGN